MFKKPTIIHQRDIILNVRKRWLEQYRGWEANHVFPFDERPLGQINKELAALDLEKCSAKDVNKVLGTTGWADNDCDQCGKSYPKIAEIGYEPDCEARYQHLCESCLSRDLKLLRAAKAKP